MPSRRQPARPPSCQVIRPASKILLEESRAELAALHTLRLLATQRHLTQVPGLHPQGQRACASLAVCIACP